MGATAFAPSPAPALAVLRVRISELRIFAAAAALIILHIADYGFAQRQAGTSAAGHLAAWLVPIGVALGAVWG
jgi:hypothetical protein